MKTRLVRMHQEKAPVGRRRQYRRVSLADGGLFDRLVEFLARKAIQ